MYMIRNHLICDEREKEREGKAKEKVCNVISIFFFKRTRLQRLEISN